MYWQNCKEEKNINNSKIVNAGLFLTSQNLTGVDIRSF